MITNKKRKICVFNGKRGGFNALTPTMQMIEEDTDLELKIILSDMHLLEQFGKTINEAKNWFSISEAIDMEQKGDSSENRVEALGVLLKKISSVFKKINPDILLILGDRSETLIAAFAALQMKIPVAHIQGGEISGNIDGIQRHAITKLAHIHFTETEKAKERVIKLGEEEWRVFRTGAPYVDFIARKMYMPENEVRKKFNLAPGEEFFLVLQHSVTTEPEKSYDQMKETIEAIKEFSQRAVVVYPCSDQGYQGIIDAIDEVKGNEQFLIYKNIEAQDFLGLQAITSVFIGNSSAGIYEAPYLHTPVVNVGIRQKGRERENNIIDADNKKEAISYGIKKALHDDNFSSKLKDLKNIYGDGKACERIVKVLKEIKIDSKLFEKN